MVQQDEAVVVAGVTATLLDYCECLDEKRLDDFMELFTEDCVFEEGKVAIGRPHIRAKVRKLLAIFAALSHHLSNIRVRPTGPDTAEAMSYIHAWHRLEAGGDLKLWGRYVDKLRLEDGRWKIAERVVLLQGSEGGEVPIRRVTQQPLPARA